MKRFKVSICFDGQESSASRTYDTREEAVQVAKKAVSKLQKALTELHDEDPGHYPDPGQVGYSLAEVEVGEPISGGLPLSVSPV